MEMLHCISFLTRAVSTCTGFCVDALAIVMACLRFRSATESGRSAFFSGTLLAAICILSARSLATTTVSCLLILSFFMDRNNLVTQNQDFGRLGPGGPGLLSDNLGGDGDGDGVLENRDGGNCLGKHNPGTGDAALLAKRA